MRGKYRFLIIFKRLIVVIKIILIEAVSLYKNIDLRIEVATEHIRGLLAAGVKVVLDSLLVVALAGIQESHHIVDLRSLVELLQDVHGGSVIVQRNIGDSSVVIAVVLQVLQGLLILAFAQMLAPFPMCVSATSQFSLNARG